MTENITFWNHWNNQNKGAVEKMTKARAREKAQWEADFYNRPTAVITDALTGYATEPMNPNIPKNEIVEILQPCLERGERGSNDLVLDR